MKKTLTVYSIAHFVVDFISAFVVFSIPNFYPNETPQMMFFIVLYGLIAFGLQVVFGKLCDKRKQPKYFALWGVSLNLLSLFLLFLSPLAATIVTGLGNALFHVGGGITSLYAGKKKATLPGIFVSTGAMGVFLGTFLPINLPFSPLRLSILAILIIILIGWNTPPKISYEKAEPLKLLPPQRKQRMFLISFFILLSIFIRSFIGFIVTFPRKVGFVLGLIFTLGVMCGKAFGGVLADKFGFEKVGITSLALSSILLWFFSANPRLWILGIFLFNMTMPITLVAISNTFKGREGFAFGLTTLVLILGALPYYAGMTLANGRIICSIIIWSVLAVWWGLYRYKKYFTS